MNPYAFFAAVVVEFLIFVVFKNVAQDCFDAGYRATALDDKLFNFALGWVLMIVFAGLTVAIIWFGTAPAGHMLRVPL